MKAAFALLLLALLARAAAATAPTRPARVGDDRPLTTIWLCENESEALVNAHPRRRFEEAWITYAGNRIAVKRVRSASGVAYASADGRLKWREKDGVAMIEFDGVLDRPLQCRLRNPRRR